MKSEPEVKLTEEILSAHITEAICKILAPDKDTIKSCSDLTKRALTGDLSLDEQEQSSKELLKSKGVKI